MLASRKRAQLMIIDVQEKLAPHVEESPQVIANCARLVRYAFRLGVPVTITEHYPKGLGATVGEVRAAAGNAAPALAKITFSCWQDEAIRARLSGLAREGRDEVVVAGMEAHVCVGQTVLELLANKLDVLLVADAVGSRSGKVRDVAIRRMATAGAQIVTHEMIAFEWLERGDTDEFKDLIPIIK